jgi:hypothetical protein
LTVIRGSNAFRDALILPGQQIQIVVDRLVYQAIPRPVLLLGELIELSDFSGSVRILNASMVMSHCPSGS